MCLLISFSAHAQYNFFYSTADSILYVDASDSLLQNRIVLRVTNGGANLERISNPAPGYVEMSDAIPGSIYAKVYDEYMRPDWYHSSDFGESWVHEPGILGFFGIPFSGATAGACWVERDSPHAWQPYIVYLTTNSWEYMDSVLINMHPEGPDDSVGVLALTHEIGTLYGLRYSDQRICISSDTGHTWSFGEGYYPSQLTYGVHCGAVDELWWRLGNQVYVALDTGRTTLGPLFQAHPPEDRPWGWHTYLAPTNNPGETYLVCTWDDGAPPPHWWWLELIIYHIRNYGATVDSFYYAGYDFDLINAVSPPHPFPAEVALGNYPNPFNSSTQISFSLPHPARATLKVIDVLGREVETLLDQEMQSGEHKITFNASGLASGIYFCRLEQTPLTSPHRMGGVQTRKMLLIR